MKNVICGWHPINDAINAKENIEKVLLAKNLDPKRSQSLVGRLQEAKIPVQFVPPERLTKYKNHQGMVAVLAEIAYADEESFLNNLDTDGNYCVILADRITDVRNIGAISRSIECFGAHAILIPDKESAAINEFAIKSSSGALLKVPVIRSANIKLTFHNFIANDFTSIACTEKGDPIDEDTFKYKRNLVILGSEEKGISPYFLQNSGCQAKIPMHGETGSLNVSVAAGIFLHEWRKSLQ